MIQSCQHVAVPNTRGRDAPKTGRDQRHSPRCRQWRARWQLCDLSTGSGCHAGGLRSLSVTDRFGSELFLPAAACVAPSICSFSGRQTGMLSSGSRARSNGCGCFRLAQADRQGDRRQDSVDLGEIKSEPAQPERRSVECVVARTLGGMSEVGADARDGDGQIAAPVRWHRVWMTDGR